MTIDKLSEFASDGRKDVDDLVLTDGFPVTRKPARQWFNWLFNTLTTKINEIIDADFMPKSDVVDNLTTNDATKSISAKQAKLLQDNKLDKTGGALTGNLEITNPSRSSELILSGLGNDGIRIGRTDGVTSTPFIDFRSSGIATGNFYNARIIASEGDSNNASGNLDYRASRHTFHGEVVADITGNATSATNCSRSIVAGNGLSGGGELSANHTITLGTPGAITASTGNTVSASSHTHNIDVNSLPLLGVGQAWQNVTGSRASGITYTNNTGKPIQISIVMYDSGVVSPVSLNISGVLVVNIPDFSVVQYISLDKIIPTGAAYTLNAGNNPIATWVELR